MTHTRRRYTEGDQARVAITLQSNDGNIRRTARETGVPLATVRDWKAKWDREGYPDDLEALLPAAIGDFIDEAQSVRWLMVERLREALDKNEVRPGDLIKGIGIITDKINVMTGLATSRTETVQVALPDATEIAKELAKFVATSAALTNERSEIIEDAEWTEQAQEALPSGATKEK